MTQARGIGGRTQGDPSTGYAEVIRNFRGTDQIGYKSAPNPGNPDDNNVYVFAEGEWFTADSQDRAVKIGSTSPLLAWPNLTGKERSDVWGARSVTGIVGFGYHLRTTGFRLDGTVTAASYTFGVALTVKEAVVGGGGVLQPATSGDTIFARLVEGVQNKQLDAERALGMTPIRKVIVVEVGPFGIA
jgi:hypothetical protein